MFNSDLESLQQFYKNLPENYYLDYRDSAIDGWGTTDIETHFDLKSNDFLNYAQLDLEMDYDHHLINCLSNVKRAIESQIDSILIGLGLFKKSKRERWNFPKKIKVLNHFNIVSPRILTKITKIRNLLEHEYSNPKKEKVEDAVDIAILFLRSTEKYLVNFPYEGVLWNPEGNALNVSFDYKQCKFVFKGLEFDKESKNILFVEEVSERDPRYCGYLEWFLQITDIENKLIRKIMSVKNN